MNRKLLKKVACVLVLVMLAAGVHVSHGEGLTFSIAGYDPADNGRDWETNAFFRRWGDMFHTSFRFQQVTDRNEWTSIKAAYLAGSAMPDMLFKAELTVQETEMLYQQGKLTDLRPLLEQYAPNFYALLQANPQWAAAITLPDGAIPALPAINQLPNNNALWINLRWLENLGLQMPTTAEELKQVLLAFRDSDPNQNGSNDEIPLTFSSMWDLRFLGHAFGIIANDYGIQLNEQGEAVSMLGSAQQRDFLAWLHGLWTERLLDQNGFVTSDQIRRVTDEKASITYGVMLGTTPLTLLPGSAMEQYGVMLPLTFQGRQQYRSLLPDLTRGAFAISSGCPNPGAALSMVDYLYGEEGARLAQAGLEGEDYHVNADGTWAWNTSDLPSPSAMLAQATIAEGGAAPGMVSLEFQMSFEDASTHRLLAELTGLKALSVLPYPQLWISSANQAKLDEIQLTLGRFAEETMVHFVTGEVPLDDAAWSTYQEGLSQRGAAELTNIFNELLNADSAS